MSDTDEEKLIDYIATVNEVDRDEAKFILLMYDKAELDCLYTVVILEQRTD